MARSASPAAPTTPVDPPVQLDAADDIIIELLSTDGRTSNKALAAATGLTEPTVAARLRRLREVRVLHVTALLDRGVLGFGSEVAIELQVRDRGIRDVAAELARVDVVTGASMVLGSNDIMGVISAAGLEAQAAAIDTVEAIEGVHRMTVAPIRRWFQYSASRASLRLGGGWMPDLSRSTVPIDALDASLIKQLIEDGRQSNRSIAREIGASETTVRAHLRRLEDGGVLRIVGVVDRSRMGANADVAWVSLDVDPAEATSVGAELSGWAEVQACFEVLGQGRIRCLVATSRAAELGRLVGERMRAIPGVHSTETYLHIEAFVHRYNLGLLA